MIKNHIKSFLKMALLLFVFLPLMANALNLGRMVTNSLQDEPLNADIELINVPTNLKTKQIKVRLADTSDLWELGLATESYHNDLRFRIYRDKDYKWFIKVKTKEAITSQFVNFIINIDYPQGHLVREYMTILKKSLYSYENNKAEGINDEFTNFELAVTQGNQKVVRFMGDFGAFDGEPILSASNNKQTKVTSNKQLAKKKLKKLKKVAVNKQSTKRNSENKVDLAKKSKNTIKTKKSTKVNKKSEGNFAKKAKAGNKPATVKASPKVARLKQVSNKINNIKINNKKIAAAQPKKPSKAKKIANKFKSTNSQKNYKAVVEYNSISANSIRTRHGDTLWEIAKKHTNSSSNIQKMVMAIYNNNRNAFISDNINILKQNIAIKIPQEKDLKNIAYNDAIKFMNSHGSQQGKANNINTNKSVRNIRRAINKVNNTVKTKITALKTKPNINIKVSNIEIPSSIVSQSAPAAQDKTLKARNILKLKSINDELKNKAKNKDKNKSIKPIKAIRSIDSINNTKKPRLKIVTSSNNENIDQRYTLATEKLLAKKQENNDLREQVTILQAQLKDIRKLVILKNKISSLNNNNDRETIVFSPFAAKNIAKVDSGNTINSNNLINKSDQSRVNTDSSVSLSNDNKTAKASTNIITSIAGKIFNKISKVSKKVVNYNYTLTLIIPIIALFILFMLSTVYYYWRKYYRLKPYNEIGGDMEPMFTEIDMPEIVEYSDYTDTEESDEYLHDDEIHDIGIESDYNLEQEREIHNSYDNMLAASESNVGAKFKDNFDLVKAYIELNDYVTARRILDEILKTGSKDQKTKAKHILETLPAA